MLMKKLMLPTYWVTTIHRISHIASNIFTKGNLGKISHGVSGWTMHIKYASLDSGGAAHRREGEQRLRELEGGPRGDEVVAVASGSGRRGGGADRSRRQ
jgi:hypothetical protein